MLKDKSNKLSMEKITVLLSSETLKKLDELVVKSWLGSRGKIIELLVLHSDELLEKNISIWRDKT